MFNKIISILILFGVSPILLSSILLIVLFDNKNPIFVQERIGKNMKPFKIFKLRTMNNNKITKLGYYLRKYSIDEFPQFFNVILGDMNIIGPRPLIAPEYIKENIYENFNDRTQILPCITGYHKLYGTTDNLNDIFLNFFIG